MTRRVGSSSRETRPRQNGAAHNGANRKRLAIAYDITSSSPMAVAALLHDVCDITWVVDSSDQSLGPMGRLLGRLGTVVDAADQKLTEVIDELAEDKVDGVIAFTDTQVLQAAFLAKALDLVHNPPTVIERLIDKHAQRVALAQGGIDVPRFRVIPAGTGVDEATALIADLPFPLVFKPIRGDSSRNVVSLRDRADLALALETVVAHPRSGFVVEEYLSDQQPPSVGGLGGYVSVEAIVQAGVPVPVAVTGKFPLAEPFREAGNFMPHPLEADVAAEVLDLATRAAGALSVETGALHIEIKLTACGPRVIEVNGRVGGGAIDAIYAKRFGPSLTELAARTAMGEPLDLVAEQAARWSGPFTYEFFAQPPTAAARFVAVNGSERILGTAGAETVAVNRSPGDELDWRNGSQGYVLQVSGAADDRDALGAVPAAVMSAAAIEYEFA